jgi:lipopolysaccharide export system permease protein
MAVIPIIHRYILREILAPFAVAVGLLTVLFFMAEMIKITNWVVNYGVGVLAVLSMLALMMPSFLVFIIPMALLLSVLLAFLRMSSDNEIIAIKSGGASIYRYLAPVVFFSAVACTLTLLMTLYGVPWGRAAFADLAFRLVTNRIDIALKEKTFNDTLDKVIVYVGSVDPKDRRWTNVFIEDKREPETVNTIVAPEGRLLSAPGQTQLRLLLNDGTIYQTHLRDRRSQAIRFTSYHLAFDLKDHSAFSDQRSKSTKELGLADLQRELATLKPGHVRYHKVRTMMQRMFSIPAACFALGLLGLPLGIQSRTAKRTFGLVLALICILLYYLLLTAGYALGEKGLIPPLAAMWLPNLIIGALAVYLLVQTAREKPSMVALLVSRLSRARPLRRGR